MSGPVEFRPAQACRYDGVALGEVMLRLDPGADRIRTARTFQVWEGGGEYNVARGLARCFGLRTAVVTALVDNEVGRLCEGLILSGGVETSWIRWLDDDGVGRTARNGLNFTERGFGVRGALGVADRGHSAASQLSPGEVAWEELFGEQGVRWFHTGGIYAGLSASTPAVIQEAMTAAKRHNTVISYDLNYRPSLWRATGGRKAAQEVNCRLARYADVIIGNEEDFSACLGYEIPGADDSFTNLSTASYQRLIGNVSQDLPNLRVVATTLREVHSATINSWGALAWSRESGFVHATQRSRLEILDRVGGGDAFASGLAYGLLRGCDLQTAIEYGAAHGALAMTTPGDTSMATAAEVVRLAGGGDARVRR